jgi:hypothetical protein
VARAERDRDPTLDPMDPDNTPFQLAAEASSDEQARCAAPTSSSATSSGRSIDDGKIRLFEFL